MAMVQERSIRNAAVVLSVAVFLALASLVVLARVPSLRLTIARTAPTYSIGERLEEAAGMSGGTNRALLIFARNECGACQASIPFLDSITKEIVSRGAGAVRVLGFDGEAEILAYANSLGLSADQIARIERTRVRIVPTMLVVDREGRILYFHEGRVSEESIESETRRLRAVFGLANQR